MNKLLFALIAILGNFFIRSSVIEAKGGEAFSAMLTCFAAITLTCEAIHVICNIIKNHNQHANKNIIDETIRYSGYVSDISNLIITLIMICGPALINNIITGKTDKLIEKILA